MNIFAKRICDLRVGDLVDLEGDKYADPNKDHPQFECEYQQVCEITVETADCIAVGFEGFDIVGFPVEHRVMVMYEGCECCREREAANRIGDDGTALCDECFEGHVRAALEPALGYKACCTMIWGAAGPALCLMRSGIEHDHG